MLAIVLATAGPRLERLLAQVASLREREKRHDQRTRQRDHGAGAVAPLLRGRACRGAHVLGQAGHVALVVQRQPVVRFVGQDVLAEARRKCGKTLDNGRAASPGFLGKSRAGTFEIKMYAPQQLQLLRVEDQFAAAAVQVVDAREKRCVEVDGAVMGGKTRRHLAFDRLQRRRRFRCGQVEEDLFDAVESTPRPVEGPERVFECCRRRLVGNGGDFRAMRTQCFGKCGLEVLRTDHCERRQPERRGPGLEQGIAVDGGHQGFTENWRDGGREGYGAHGRDRHSTSRVATAELGSSTRRSRL